MKFSVDNLLNLGKNFKEIKVLAGHKGLDSPIKDVQVMEVPDGAYWVKEGDFLITTGFGFKDNTDQLLDIVKILIEKKASALAIKKGRFLTKIPETVIDLANKSNLPILEIPIQIGYRDITWPIMEKIMDNENYSLKIIEQLRDTLLQSHYNRNNLNDILSILSFYTNKSVIIFDNHLDVFNINNYENIDYEIIDLITDFIKDNKHKLKTESTNFVMQGSSYNSLIFPLNSGSEVLGYLCVFSNEKINDLDKSVISQSVPYFMLCLSQKKYEEHNSTILRKNFFENLIFGNYLSAPVIQSGKKLFNLVDNLNRFIIIIGFLGLSKNEIVDKYKEVILSILNKHPFPNEPEEIIFHNQQIIILINQQKEYENKEFKKIYKDWFIGFKTNIKYFNPSVDTVLGVGSEYADLIDISKSFKEASLCLKLGPQIYNSEYDIYFYQNLKLYHILFTFNNHPLLKQLYNDTVNNLLQYDKKNSSQLVETLICLYRCNSNIKKTAKTLFIHRNTLYSRLDKISKITGIDPISSEGQISFQISLKLKDIYEL